MKAPTEREWLDGVVGSFFFWAAAHLIIERDALLAEAARCERRNAPWARNRRRRAARLFEEAKALCGGRPLPWGVQD